MATAAERLTWLKQQLAQGWYVDVPVIERINGTGRTGYIQAYEFILRHEHGCQAVSVPDSPELRGFLQEHKLQVVSF